MEGFSSEELGNPFRVFRAFLEEPLAPLWLGSSLSNVGALEILLLPR